MPVTLKRLATAFFVLRLAIGFGIRSPYSIPCRAIRKGKTPIRGRRRAASKTLQDRPISAGPLIAAQMRPLHRGRNPTTKKFN